MTENVNWSALDSDAKLKLVTKDILGMLTEIRSLIRSGGELDCAVDSALNSFVPLMDSLGIEHAPSDVPTDQASTLIRSSVSGPKARRGSKRPSTTRLESTAKRVVRPVSEDESDVDDPAPAFADAVVTEEDVPVAEAEAPAAEAEESNVSPKLTHHSFRGDSSIEVSNRVEATPASSLGSGSIEETLENIEKEVTRLVKPVQTARKHTGKVPTARKHTAKRQTAKRGRPF